MTDAIGGYFGLEELTLKAGSFIQECGVLLNSGRNAFRYILLSIPDKIEKLYLPYYTCPVVWHGLAIVNKHSIIQRLNFYRVDENLEIADDIQLGEHDYIVVNNYFGIKDQYIAQLASKYGNHMIVDNAQAFFAPVLPNTYAFYSPRKYLGVPDGGVAYLSDDAKPIKCIEQDDSSDRLEHLKLRREKGAEAGFGIYQLNEKKLDDMPIRLMSDYTHEVLSRVDYEKVLEKRRANYQLLHDALGEMNELSLPSMDTFVCPMVYPFNPKKGNANLRKKLQEQRIFTATYWPKLAELNNGKFEENLAKTLIPLPIDQRYGEEEMNRIINVILEK